ncbi:hypothetical protein DF186_19240, partial [Enterococcus hirae]
MYFHTNCEALNRKSSQYFLQDMALNCKMIILNAPLRIITNFIIRKSNLQEEVGHIYIQIVNN